MRSVSPTTLFSLLISHLFAKRAETAAANRQDATTISIGKGYIFAPMEMWLTVPVRATSVMIMVLVPTAIFRLYWC